MSWLAIRHTITTLPTIAVGRQYLEEASLSHLSRKTTESRSRAVTDWIRDHIRAERRYKPPPDGKMRKNLRRERKEAAARYFQLLSGHAAIGSFLAERTGSVPSSECWWCGSGKRQSRHHLFIECRQWTPEIKKLWKEVGKACEWKHPRPTVRLLFNDDRATPAVLDFLRDTRVGRVFTPAALEEGEEDGQEEIELRPWEGEFSWNENGEEGGPGPP